MDRETFLAFLARLLGEGEPLTAAEFADFQAGIGEHATDDELAQIEAGCRALGDDDEVPLDVIRAAVALAEGVRAEADTRIAAAEAETAERDALRAQLAGEPVAETPEEEGAAPASEQVPVATAAAPAAPTPRTPPRPAATALRRRSAGAVEPVQRRAHNRIVRDGGGEYTDLREAGEAALRRRESFLSANQGDAEQVTVASILAEYPPERCLDQLGSRELSALIAGITAELDGANAERLDAVTAAGGTCAPVVPFYGIPSISTGDRPFRDSFLSARAPRMGISFRRPSDFTDFRTATGQWTRDNDTTPGSDGPATKPLLTVNCLDVTTEYLYAVTMRLQFGNFMAVADPERVEDATTKTLHAHASRGEQLLLDAVKGDSTAVDGGAVFGAWRDLLYHWGVTAAGYRSRRRMSPNAVMELRAPAWVLDMLREDISRALNAYPEQAAAPDSVINGALAVRGIRPYWFMDSPAATGGIASHNQVFGPQNATAIVDFPESVQWQMSPPGTFLFLENGQLNFGPVRDSTLIGTNDYQTFAEDLEGIARIGYQSIWGTSIVCPNGASAGTSSPDSICTSGQEYIPTGSGIGAFVAP